MNLIELRKEIEWLIDNKDATLNKVDVYARELKTIKQTVEAVDKYTIMWDTCLTDKTPLKEWQKIKELLNLTEK